ncbi:hypothetical protein V0288_17890 [Pannus brasiliensis CCIBt3594]|uniref:Uncharacterized protein n=1 Tax=Pannus brasiliensis CCIBt3594 TaxID=1427578 RepID=A0AAW9QWR0_9CHRO
MKIPVISVKWLWWTSTPIFVIVCTAYTAILNPRGVINTFLIHCIDVVMVVWPSTPENFKIGVMLSAFASQFPNIGWGLVSEIVSGVLGILVIISTLKVLKYIPFF